jgi:hypothetical protein
MLSLFVILGLLGVLWTGKSLRRALKVSDRRVLDLVLNSTDGRAKHNDVALAA